MIQSGRRVQDSPYPAARLAARARLTAKLVRDEVMAGSPVLVCVGLVSLSLLLQTLVLFSPGHFRPADSTLFSVLVPGMTLSGMALLIYAALPHRQVTRKRLRQGIAATGLAVLAVLSVVGAWHAIPAVGSMAQDNPPSNDGAVMDYYAARQVLHVHNPYVKTNIVAALASINAPATTVTPLMRGEFRGALAYPTDGAIQQAFLNDLRYRSRPGVPIPPEFESKYNYPAGSFLIILPFVWAGIHDLRFLYALAVLLMGYYVWFRMPRSLRFMVPLLLLSDVPVLTGIQGGQPDPLYALFLMIGLAEWKSSRLSPVMLGLSAATKQLAWFFLPFYLVYIVRECGWRSALQRSGIILAVFGVVNGPFIVQSPGAYISSISGPMSDPMFPLGIGVVALFAGGVLPLLSKAAFTAAELLTWVASMAAFARLRILTLSAAVTLSALPLFFAWRSLVNYFYLLPLLTLAVVLADQQRQRSNRLAVET